MEGEGGEEKILTRNIFRSWPYHSSVVPSAIKKTESARKSVEKGKAKTQNVFSKGVCKEIIRSAKVFRGRSPGRSHVGERGSARRKKTSKGRRGREASWKTLGYEDLIVSFSERPRPRLEDGTIRASRKRVWMIRRGEGKERRLKPTVSAYFLTPENQKKK